MTLIPEHKKRRMLWGAIFGAFTGALLFAALYLTVGANIVYAAMIPIGAAVGAAQMYLARNE